MNIRRVTMLVVLIGSPMTSFVGGQNVVVSTPFQQTSDSYYERNGVSFGFDIAPRGREIRDGNGPGIIGLLPNGQPTPDGAIQFRQGGFNSAIPPFGGFDPNGGGTLGFSVRGPGGALNLGIAAVQGSNRSISTVTPTIVVPNGGTGTLIDVIQRPFVTGFLPVFGGGFGGIGNFGMGFPSPTPQPPAWTRSYKPGQPIPSDAANRRLARSSSRSEQSERQEPSSAELGDISVAEIRRRQQAEDAARDSEQSALLTAARAAEADGDLKTALQRYDDLRRQLDTQERAAVETRIRNLRLRIKQTSR